MTLYTFGDCHADAPWAWLKVSDTKFHEINYNGVFSRTMGRLCTTTLEDVNIKGFYHRTKGKPTWDLELREKWEKLSYPYDDYFNVQEGDAVVFSFGEIDCRTHLSMPIHSETWKELIDEMVPRYMNMIKANVEQFTKLHTMLFNIVPPVSDEHFEKYCPTYPRAGTGERRREIVIYMNDKLREQCKIYNYIFLDVYDKYCDSEGYINMKYSDGCSHIKYPGFIVEFLNNLDIYD